MADTLCAACGKPIRLTDSKVTIQDVSYYSSCWDRRQAKRSKGA